MTGSMKLAAGAAFPAQMTWPKVDGDEVTPAANGGWRMLVVYRGRHCPLCKKYLKSLDSLLGEFEAAGIAVMAVSSDPEEKAAADAAEQGWRFPLGYGMTVAQMQELGLYVSEPRSPEETDRPFPEPGLFVLNPAGKVQIIDVSNAPFARPELSTVLSGIKFVQAKQYPIRGTLA